MQSPDPRAPGPETSDDPGFCGRDHAATGRSTAISTRLVLTLCCIATVVSSVPFIVLGAWPVAWFFGIDLIALFIAFHGQFQDRAPDGRGDPHADRSTPAQRQPSRRAPRTSLQPALDPGLTGARMTNSACRNCVSSLRANGWSLPVICHRMSERASLVNSGKRSPG